MKMKNTGVYMAAGLVMLMIACRPKNTDNHNLSAPPVNVAPVTAPGLPAPSVPSGGGAVRPAVNPAHGQPFHDCNIAVGAPLPAAAQPASAAPGQAVPSAPGNKPGVRLNPAHGQPGHRCEIAVGAPLS